MVLVTVALCVFPLTRELETQLTDLLPKVTPAVAFIDGGAGVVISPEGLVLSCNHVVALRLKTWEVYLADGERFEGRVVGRQVENDIALVKLQGARGLPYLPLAPSGTVKVGDVVVALGNPFMLGTNSYRFLRVPPFFEPSASCGIVSGVHRFSRLSADVIECDAALNPGNSGGPVVNLRGEVVGLGGRIANRFGLRANSGVGYGPSCDLIQRMLPALLRAEGGEVFVGDLPGVVLQRRNREVVVQSVAPESRAARAGFRKDDVVVAVGPMRITTPDRFLSAIASYPAESSTVVWVRRAGGDLFLPVELESRATEVGFLGVKVRAGKAGLLVEDVTGPAKEAGIQPNDVLLSVGNVPISAAEELKLLLMTREGGDKVVVTVKRKEKELRLLVTLKGIKRHRQGRPYL